MWRRIVRAFAALSFFAGVVGWITLPDDAALWPKRLRPLVVAVGREEIIIALFALSALGFAWTIFAPIAIGWIARRRTPPLSVHFPDIANSPYYETSFRQKRPIWGNLGEDVTPLIFHRYTAFTSASEIIQPLQFGTLLPLCVMLDCHASCPRSRFIY
jgi:hypothetical protein